MTRTMAYAIAAGVALIALAGLPAIANALGSPSLVALATRALIYGIAATSLNLVLGYGGLVSFGHAAFYGIGGYAAGLLTFHYVSDEPLLGIIPGTNDLLATLAAAALVSGAVAAAIGAMSLRTRGVQFIMITLAFAQMLFFFFVSLKAYGGDDGLTLRRRNVLLGLDLRNDTDFYFVTLAFTGLAIATVWIVTRSSFGLVLGGIRQSEVRMEAIGISSFRYKLVAFILSGMGTGLAGALMANQARFVSPDMMHWSKSGELLVMVILGGIGTTFGPLAGAVAFVVLDGLLSVWFENAALVFGFILLAIVLFTRGGLSNLFPLHHRRTA
jgi:branched-chain amino acid transport system permease protein